MNSSVFCAVGREPVVGLGEHLAQILHAAGHRAELPETAAALAGQQPGQGRLARAGRAVEDHRAEPVGLQQPPQQLPFAEEMLLARRTRPAGPAASAPPAAWPFRDWLPRWLRTVTFFRDLRYEVRDLGLTCRVTTRLTTVPFKHRRLVPFRSVH